MRKSAGDSIVRMSAICGARVSIERVSSCAFARNGVSSSP